VVVRENSVLSHITKDEEPLRSGITIVTTKPIVDPLEISIAQQESRFFGIVVDVTVRWTPIEQL
jgi:hypothetical protein